MDRSATARWDGDLRSGQGKIRLGSGAFEGKYSFTTRFEEAPGTNPEELIGAAHAACFSMALAASLAKAGKAPQSIETKATVHLEKGSEGSSITSIDLVTEGRVPGTTNEEFQRMAEETKSGCIVSRALSAVPMRVQATLLHAD